jgi:hypothetical protein
MYIACHKRLPESVYSEATTTLYKMYSTRYLPNNLGQDHLLLIIVATDHCFKASDVSLLLFCL